LCVATAVRLVFVCRHSGPFGVCVSPQRSVWCLCVATAVRLVFVCRHSCAFKHGSLLEIVCFVTYCVRTALVRVNTQLVAVIYCDVSVGATYRSRLQGS